MRKINRLDADATKARFTALMKFHSAWTTWEMYPDELLEIQKSDYTPGSESSPEHYRYGAFRWWLARKLTVEQMAKYLALTFLDNDQTMAQCARQDLILAHEVPPPLLYVAQLQLAE